ncbi:protein transport protein Sec31A-like isoform X2 [Saccostrea echinata]|uniref:protein transport protein Sec31A-like isoform X2 n=1 Tax=Saccostrea echinata TaxID=191078 RepID=UPI002A7F3A9A|nr:protein transport protein Sec31A-like isoform X2 [Saccostrea echinata]
MRVKEIERTANVAWSPAQQYPIYMVAGTAAQQLDATFSTSAALEVYHLNLADPSLDMPLVASVPSECRFHKVVWGSHGMTSTNMSSGVVVAGADNGSMYYYDAAGMIKGDEDCLMFKKNKHVGAVKALDFNPFQTNLLASGASESEIYIWDLNKPDNPMTPGAKSQPPEEVACVAWNKQVQHILGSTFAARCVVWDLRKNEPIIKISDSMSRIKAKIVSWHPDVATQLCLSSEDDHTPVIQLWDLRYATSPVKQLENHTRGVLDIAWCPQDPDLLLSCGKDNRILCWNPNSNVQGGEVVYELPTSNQWCFDVKWCPRNPAVISSSSFDGHVTVYSLMGGGHPIHHSDKVADAFQSNDPFAQTSPPSQTTQNVMPLQKPPKWLRKPVGANFGFGGRLVSFDTEKSQNPQQPAPKMVYISQVVTETDLLQRSLQLEQALENGQYVEYCAMKSANCTDPLQENIWNFLRVNFEKEPREHFIQLLGYDKTDLAKKVSEHVGMGQDSGVDAKILAQKMSQLSPEDLQQSGRQASVQGSPVVGSKTPLSQDEAASAFDEIGLSQSSKSEDLDQESLKPLLIPTDQDADGLLSQALLTGNFEAAVEICLCENKMAEAIILAIAGGPDLLSRTQKRFFQQSKCSIGRLISSVVTHDWSHIVETCDLSNWKEALALILTYASPDEFSTLCDSLANRLESESADDLSVYASLCYICSGNVEKLLQNWYANTEGNNTPLGLQDMVEKVMLLRKAVELSRGQATDISGGLLAEKMNEYASLLAAQGSLDTAVRYLGNSTDTNLMIMKDRLYNALGVQGSPCPFQKINVLPAGAPQPQQRTTQAQRPTGQVGTHQTQAKGSFGTVTTPSSSYNNPMSYTAPYTHMNGVTSQPSYYNPTANVAPKTPPSSTGAMSKGALSHKYPSHPATTSAYDPYTQGGYQPNNQPYNPVPAYDPSYYSGMGASNQPSNQPTNMYQPFHNPGSASMAPPPVSDNHNVHSFMNNPPPSAWNDPPPLKEKKPKNPPTQYDGTAITSPLYGTLVPQDPNQAGGATNYSLYNPQEHQAEIQPAQPPRTLQNASAPPGSQQKAAASVAPPEPPKPVEKGPIPSEHQVLQDIFNSLVHNCSNVASNAQMKRKLDDVSKKLELLYDRLRDHSLSQSVILGLHQIVQAIQQYDYNTALQIYTQMISQGNFSEISSFMPGLKMLIQSAMQMNVYVQAH